MILSNHDWQGNNFRLLVWLTFRRICGKIGQMEKRLQDCFYYSGACMAGLYKNTAAWASRNARHPVKVALRDGEAILHTAKWLQDHGKLDAANWSEIHANTANASKPNLFKGLPEFADRDEYFRQNGLDKPFTLVDTGTRGTIPRNIINCGGQVQSLLMAFDNASGPAPADSAAMLNQQNLNAVAARVFADAQFRANHPNFVRSFVPGNIDTDFTTQFCLEILEHVPKKHHAVKADNKYVRTNGRIEPELVPHDDLQIAANKSFLDGITHGLENDRGESPEQNLKKLVTVTPQIQLTFHDLYNLYSEQNRENPPPMTDFKRRRLPLPKSALADNIDFTAQKLKESTERNY
jgi:hypothetical protein